MGGFTSYLFARSSFLEGAGRILDFGNFLSEYNEGLTPEQADALALRADLLAVGGDIRVSAEHLLNEAEAAELASEG